MKLKICLFDFYMYLIGLNIASILIDILFRIEIFRQVIGSIYLTIFIGPILTYYLFKDVLNNGFLEYILHSVGISIICILFSTILLNFFVGLNTYILIFSVNFLVVALVAIKHKSTKHVNFNLTLNCSALFICLAVFLISLISTYMCTYYLINLIMILVILFDFLIVISTYKLNKNIYVYIILFYSLSLLILNSTTSYFFRVTDNIVEYYFSKMIIEHSYWLYNLHNDINSMPGAVLIPAIYSEYCGYSLNTFFKVMLPILASLIPVILYKSYLKLFSDKISIYSVLFFATMYIFYTWFGLTAKQVSSGIFLALLVLVILSDYNKVSKAALSILYSAGIIICHYGTAYIFLSCVIGFYIFNLIIKNNSYTEITGTYIIFYVVTAIGWYIYVASSAPFSTIVNIAEHYIRLAIFGKFITSNSYGGQILFSKLPTYLRIMKYLYYLSIFFILAGFISTIVNRKVNKFFILSLTAIIFDFLSFSGNLSSAVTPDRILQITSFFISPFFVLGFKYLNKLIKLDSYWTIAIFLSVFLLFNTCLVAEIIWKYNVGPTVCISYPRIIKSGSIVEREYLSRVYLFLADIYGAKWIHTFYIHSKIFCGINSKKDFTYCGFTSVDANVGTRNVFIAHQVLPKSYLYISYFNTVTSKIKVTGGLHPKLISLHSLKFYKFNKVYTNSYCRIFRYR